MIKKLICRLFGHVHVEEMYAAPLVDKEHRYVVIKECNCARCGKNISFEMSEPMSRKEFKAGWTNKMFVRADLMPHHIRITDVKIERLQDISEGECRHEGIGYHRYRDEVWSDDSLWGYYVHKNGLLLFDTPHEAFISLIDKISGKGTWENNPWVVVYSFELVD